MPTDVVGWETGNPRQETVGWGRNPLDACQVAITVQVKNLSPPFASPVSISGCLS
jgi:hypothetical protein